MGVGRGKGQVVEINRKSLIHAEITETLFSQTIADFPTQSESEHMSTHVLVTRTINTGIRCDVTSNVVVCT